MSSGATAADVYKEKPTARKSNRKDRAKKDEILFSFYEYFPQTKWGTTDQNKMKFFLRFACTFHHSKMGDKWPNKMKLFYFRFFCTLHYTRRESKCNLAMYIGKYHKNPKPTNGILLLWSHVIRLCKKSFGYLFLATRGVTNVDCVKQNCANYISCTDYICSRWGIWNLWLRVWPSLRLSQQHCFIITLTKSGVSRCFQT